jgi:hypothetical protein
MTGDRSPAIVIVPGLRGHVPEHWQTILAGELPHARSVPRIGGDNLPCAVWVELLDRTIAQTAGPVILVAHSAGVMMVARWARTHNRHVVGALLAAPPDFETPMPAPYPTMEALASHGWLPMPRQPLPFPSIVAASTNDPLASFERARGLARCWGSRFVDIGAAGHLNPASGFGPWPRAHDFIRELADAPLGVAQRVAHGRRFS